MNLLGLTIARTKTLQTKALPPLRGLNPSGNGWWPWGVIRESFTGAWQQNVELRADTALSYFAVYACTRLIATDMGKMCLRLMMQDADGIWTEADSPAFSPVLRKPNRYQTINKFVESWILSKLNFGNAYVLKQRDQRNVVVKMYVLDPSRVTPLVSYEGAVYYELRRDDLSGLRDDTVTVPASEIIHDTMVAPFHPLIGLSPLFACSLSVSQGLAIQSNSNTFFSTGSKPGGVLTAPGAISDETAARLKAYWDANYTGSNVGKVAVLGDGLTYEAMSVNAVDSQLVEQLKMSAEQVCSCYGVPPYLVDIGPPPPYANFEPLLLKYHSQCIQSLATNFEKSLDEGLGILEKVQTDNGPVQYGTEFDIDDLIWMDTETRISAMKEAIGSGGMSPDEARKKFIGLGTTPGGDTPYMQQQYWPLKQLSGREQPSVPAAPSMTMPASSADPAPDEAMKFASALHRKALTEGLYAA